MTRQEKALCELWDTLRGNYPSTSDQLLLQKTVELYRIRFHDDVTADDILNALERRSNE